MFERSAGVTALARQSSCEDGVKPQIYRQTLTAHWRDVIVNGINTIEGLPDLWLDNVMKPKRQKLQDEPVRYIGDPVSDGTSRRQFSLKKLVVERGRFTKLYVGRVQALENQGRPGNTRENSSLSDRRTKETTRGRTTDWYGTRLERKGDVTLRNR